MRLPQLQGEQLSDTAEDRQNPHTNFGEQWQYLTAFALYLACGSDRIFKKYTPIIRLSSQLYKVVFPSSQQHYPVYRCFNLPTPFHKEVCRNIQQ